MNKAKVIYRVVISVSLYKLSFAFEDIKDAQYLVDSILLNLDKEESDVPTVAIYPELPETGVAGNE